MEFLWIGGEHKSYRMISIFVFVDCKNQLIKEIRKGSAANIVLLKCVAERLRLEIYTRFDQRSSIES